MSEIANDFGFLCDSSLMENYLFLYYIQKYASDLSSKYETDLNAFDFNSEIKYCKSQILSLLLNLEGQRLYLKLL